MAKEKRVKANPVQAQLRIIWNHVRWLVEQQMEPSPQNRIRLQKQDKLFTQAERPRTKAKLTKKSKAV